MGMVVLRLLLLGLAMGLLFMEEAILVVVSILLLLYPKADISGR